MYSYCLSDILYKTEHEAAKCAVTASVTFYIKLSMRLQVCSYCLSDILYKTDNEAAWCAVTASVTFYMKLHIMRLHSVQLLHQ